MNTVALRQSVYRQPLWTALLGVLLLAGLASQPALAEPDARKEASRKIWEEQLKPQNFGDRTINEGAANDVIDIKTPFRADDPTLVPVSIHSKLNEDSDRYVSQLHVFIDKNPLPLVGRFDLTENSGKADLAMRVRVDDFSYVRVIAETNDGELYMAENFVRSLGGCSAPPGEAAEQSKQHMGEIAVKTIGEFKPGEPNLAQLQVRHPNITGMAIDQRTRSRPPAHFVKRVEVNYGGEKVLSADLTFAISLDPTFRFFFIPDGKGEFEITATDTKDQTWSEKIPVG
ncbi:sulfur-oxidizing protein SoxY [Methylohalomonas lacus]|uniref:Sulfur-oxidizing protein SoxY n=1 Tax=Methylohalomonas lacus TaxID=398773 RepID=A0AAE3HNQ6_9GAMM|nr:quinoprotein dehydrogenase-associated SoxYZ-like carrier [Methylohalomonas lacus]MCS3904559.1 sulfur-oxidizing protein SoxY [Methylohalomonas lacus]